MWKIHHLKGQWSNYGNQSFEFFFLLNKFVLNPYKRCAVSVSNTGKQQFTANQSINKLTDKDRSVPDDIDLWRSVCTRLLYYSLPNLPDWPLFPHLPDWPLFPQTDALWEKMTKKEQL